MFILLILFRICRLSIRFQKTNDHREKKEATGKKHTHTIPCHCFTIDSNRTEINRRVEHVSIEI